MAKRYRATALVIRNDKVLLVRDKGIQKYSMPGGEINPKETTLMAGIRELYEETKLRTVSAERLRYCDFEGQRAKHKVCLLRVEGNVHINHKELDGYIWWDMKKHTPKQGHVNKILHEYKKRNPVL